MSKVINNLHPFAQRDNKQVSTVTFDPNKLAQALFNLADVLKDSECPKVRHGARQLRENVKSARVKT